MPQFDQFPIPTKRPSEVSQELRAALGINSPVVELPFASNLVLDVTDGYSRFITLTGDVTNFTITDSQLGDNGVIEIKQDATGGWVFASAYTVLTGELASITNITPTTGLLTMSWYHSNDGIVLYLSEPT